MGGQSTRIISDLIGFVSLPTGGTMQVLVPAGATIQFEASPDNRDLASVEYHGRLFLAGMRDVRACIGAPPSSSKPV